MTSALQTAIEQFRTDAGLAHDWVHGNPANEIATEGGDVATLPYLVEHLMTLAAISGNVFPVPTPVPGTVADGNHYLVPGADASQFVRLYRRSGSSAVFVAALPAVAALTTIAASVAAMETFPQPFGDCDDEGDQVTFDSAGVVLSASRDNIPLPLTAGAFVPADQLGAALTAETNRALAAEAAVAATVLQAQHRPGDGLARYTATLTGEAAAGAPPPGNIAAGSNGRELRITGAGAVATRERIALEPGRSYGIRAVLRRAINPNDPLGDAVQLVVQWLDAAKAAISQTIINQSALFVAAGRVEWTAVLAGSAGAGLTVWPAGACYAAILVKTFGLDGITGVEVIGWEDNTAMRAEVARATAQEAALAAAIDAEEARAVAAETDVAADAAAALAGEVSRATTVEAALGQEIDDEIARAVAAETAVAETAAAALAAEVSRATGAEAGIMDFVEGTVPFAQYYTRRGRNADTLVYDAAGQVLHALRDGLEMSLIDGQMSPDERAFAAYQLAETAASILPWQQYYPRRGNNADDVVYALDGTVLSARRDTLPMDLYDPLVETVSIPADVGDAGPAAIRVREGTIERLAADGRFKPVSVPHFVEQAGVIMTSAGPRYQGIWSRPAAGPREGVLFDIAFEKWVSQSVRTLDIYLVKGQSRSQGRSGIELISQLARYPNHIHMFDTDAARGGSDIRAWCNNGDGQLFKTFEAAEVSGLTPLIAKLGRFDPESINGGGILQGETVGESFANTLHELLYEAFGLRQQMLMVAVGQGGAGLGAVGPPTSDPWKNARQALRAARTQALLRGLTPRLAGALILHGESDAAALGYYAGAANWQAELTLMAREELGQYAPVPFYWCIPSSAFRGEQFRSPRAMIDLCRNRPDVHRMVCVDYAELPHYNRNADDLHNSALGYYLTGHHCALAVFEATCTRGGRRPMAIDKTPGRITIDGNTISLPLLTRKPIRIDTTTITERATTNKGFALRRAGETLPAGAIDSVTVDNFDGTRPTVLVTLATAPQAGDLIEVGIAGYEDPAFLLRPDYDERGRTNVSEIDGYASDRGPVLHRWLAPDLIQVPI